MVPTGSTCGQSSPISARRRARLRLVALGLVLLVAATAHADWRTASVPGTPREVDVWEPGTFSVATSSHAVLFRDGGIVLQLDGGSVGTALTGEGCFVSVLPKGERVSASSVDGGTPGPCVPSDPIIDDPSNTGLSVQRMKQLPDGPGMAVAYPSGNPLSVSVRYSPDGVKGPADGSPWRSMLGESQLIGASSNAFGVTRVDGVDHGLFATQSPPGQLIWFQPGVWGVPLDTPSTQVVRAVDLSFLGSGLAPYAVFGSASGLYRGMLQGTPNDFTAALLPAGLSNVSGVDVNLEPMSGVQGSFGMAVVQLPDGGHGVLSALPVANPAQAGSEWLLNPTLPSSFASADLEEVSCAGASHCVITVNRNGGDNLLIYSNEHPPEISTETSVVVGEGESHPLEVFVSDDDGDAVRVTSSPQIVNVPEWTLSTEPPTQGEALRLLITGGSVCEDTVVSSVADGGLSVMATDGLLAHEVRLPIGIQVKHTRLPERPQVSPAQPRIAAGSASPLVLTASGVPTSEGCLPTGFRWRERADGGAVWEGNTFAFQAPRNVCEAAGVDYAHELVAYDSAGESLPTSFSVHVDPWGPPDPAFGADAGVSVHAGEPFFFGPQSLHVCQGAGGFPGVETTWSLAAGSTPPPGIEFLDTDGGVVQLPVQAGMIGVSSPACEDARFRLGAENRLWDGTPGPASEVEVTVAPRLRPLESGELSLLVEQPAVGELDLSVSSDLDCPGRRGLYADLRLERVVGGSEPVSGSVSVPGSVRLALPAGCRGERFRVTGTMREDGGTDFVERSWEVEADSRGLTTALEPLPPEVKLVARCGEGARGTLTQTFPEEACSNPLVTWSQVGGPALEEGSLSGDSVAVSTRDTELDALVGESVVLRVTASDGPGNEATREHRVPITTEPFIEVRRRAELPAAADTSLVGVSVELLNTTACGVRGVRFEERLDGLTYVPGSARFDGAPVEARWEDDTLTVEGLALEGQGSGMLSYVARPRLLGARNMRGEALLRGIPVSLDATPGTDVPASGCGCSGAGGSGSALLALGALLSAVRRRRR